ncbi:LexA family transcriptional regulator [Pseudomonas sp. CCI2.4]|uniref:XRE family transcriptional regulator n=1 Tax=Pseudomonas sp. CCI2.4 TaxID=3048617 RepID=UPI002B23D02D|nr:LexA family transcriptional regulator [Pseudomonas sp. CCI2.4]MEB0133451.1 LexA family transcriptional regulator [Pseudomonas sp. CCI2.4]
MHKTIDKILAELMFKSGLNQAELARLAAVGQPTISRILNPSGTKGIKEPTDKQVRPLADFFGVSTDQLRGYSPIDSASDVEEEPLDAPSSAADLVREMLAKHGKSLSEAARQKIADAVQETAVKVRSGNIIIADFSRPGLVGDEIRIAHYDIRGAMGNGQQVADFPEMLKDVRISQTHLRELGIEYEDYNYLKLVTGWGQSMQPTIKHRDPLIVDVSIREFVGDGIYLFSWDDLLYIKRLQAIDAEYFEMISDNTHHKDKSIRRDDTHILARVLLVWNAQLV